MLQLMLVVALVFSVGIAVFAVQNTTPVPVQFLGWRAEAVAASVLVLVSAALGAAVMLLFGAAREVQLRLRLRAQGHELSTSRDRVRELEVPPAGDGVAAT
jgi:putative membrane protein